MRKVYEVPPTPPSELPLYDLEPLDWWEWERFEARNREMLEEIEREQEGN